MKESFLRKVEICKKGEGLNERLSFYLYEMNLKMRESIFIVRLNKEVYGIEKDLNKLIKF